MSGPAPGHPPTADGRERLESGVLAVAAELAAELDPSIHPWDVRLDSRLDRDLGLDSLAVAELLSRLEHHFDVELPDSALARATTPGDLVGFVDAASRGGIRSHTQRPVVVGPPTVPSGGTGSTLTAVLDEFASAEPDRLHLRVLGEGDEEPMTYGDLRRRAGEVAAGLAARGIAPHDRVALMLPTQPGYFTTFFGVLLAGAVPVPIYPPTRRAQIGDHLRRHARILDNAGARMLVTVPEAQRLGAALRANVPTMGSVVCAADLPLPDEHEPDPSIAAADLALIQYTSGSTGNPKGVALTHANLLANVRAMGVAAAVTPADVFVSWLPLYHDMGLIGAWLGSLCLGMPLVVMPPTAFLRRPDRWLRTISEVGGTISASPNFGYELCVNKIDDRDLDGLELSSWRLAFNGAEAVRPETVERFAERFGRCGFRAEAMTPVYGLAESSVGLAFPPLGRGPLVDRIDRHRFATSGQAEPASADASLPLRFVACGRALAGHEIEVVDASRRPLGDRREGRIRFRGPSVTAGYFNSPEATAATISDGWVDSGDLGYLDAGELYVTGRVKDLVIKAGHNLHPEELEGAIGQLPGVRKGRVAVLGATDPATGTERLVVLAEVDTVDPTPEADRRELRDSIRRLTIDLLGTPPDEIALVAPGTLLKTSSGKLRRSASLEAYERGRPDASRQPVWWQVARVRLGAGWRPLRPAWGRVADAVRSVRAWAALVAIAPIAVVLVVAAPTVRWRWRVARASGRVLGPLAGVPLIAAHLDRLPEDGPFVLVANHSGFLDAIVLAVLVPRDLRFVAASELFDHRILGIVLRRLGVESVDRRNRPRSIDVTTRMVELVREGDGVVVFPEGRLSTVPGLQPFHLGAFVVAATAGCPVVPIAICGSRDVLRPGGWRIRPGPIQIEVGEPLTVEEGGWTEAVCLRDAAKEWLVRQVTSLHDRPLLDENART